MSRWKIIVEYDGGPFVGWQRQATGLSVQQALEEAIAAFAQEKVTLFGAGRTDSGVHALAQAAHFDLAKEAEADTVRDAINFHLKPHPVAVLQAEPAANDFHARFDATGRRYRYRIANRRAPATLARGRVWHVPQALDESAMAEAAALLIGHHDFTSFRAAECQAKSPVKTLDRLDVLRDGEEIVIEAAARSFLHHQVRNMAGTLKLVGAGQWQPGKVAEALAAKDRAAAGPTAPAEGLYLVAVDYD